MSDDAAFDQFDQFDFDPAPPHHAERLAFGDTGLPWRSAPGYDGVIAPAPRRAELLGDAETAWWDDVAAWADWAIRTFRLTRWFPPCWRRHSALVEEMQALWLLWCVAWLPGVDPGAPVGFLHNLDLALGRIEHRWQIPCSADDHTEPTPTKPSKPVRPITDQWWSNPAFAGPTW
jgi:hypothetical protein